MNQRNDTSHCDLQRLSDYALDESDLPPLVRTLAADLFGQTTELKKSLSDQVDVIHLHPVLHAIKGMAGMFAQPDLWQRIAGADDACRQGDQALGLDLAAALVAPLDEWLTEIRTWLQRYS
ncbi:MAG: Hpt domain-containing protein [Alphaproteobacteria bacterium]|nr:Hpt domain-containing protein [Alphaproteobacteria bacterium]